MMSGGISSLKYVKNNKRKVGVVITALAVCISGIYLINFLLNSIADSLTPFFKGEAAKKTAFIDISNTTLGVYGNGLEGEEFFASQKEARDRFIEDLKKVPGIKDAVYTQMITADYKSFIGEMHFDYPMLEKDAVPGYLKSINAELISGKMPENDGDVLMDSVLLKNNGLKVGDYLRESIFGKNFKIVGELRSDCYALCAVPNNFMNSGWALLVTHDGTVTDMKKAMEDAGWKPTEYDSISDYKEGEKMYKEEVTDVIDVSNRAILLGLSFLVSFAVMVVIISYVRERKNEMCLYRSIGYSGTSIYGMLMGEMGLIFAIAAVFGLVLTVAGLLGLKSLMLDPSGQVSVLYHPEAVLEVAAVLAALLGIVQLPILITLNKIKTIDQVEE